jgi:hypothetical protein
MTAAPSGHGPRIATLRGRKGSELYFSHAKIRSPNADRKKEAPTECLGETGALGLPVVVEMKYRTLTSWTVAMIVR